MVLVEPADACKHSGKAWHSLLLPAPLSSMTWACSKWVNLRYLVQKHVSKLQALFGLTSGRVTNETAESALANSIAIKSICTVERLK